MSTRPSLSLPAAAVTAGATTTATTGSFAGESTPMASRMLSFLRGGVEVQIPMPLLLWPFAEELRARVLAVAASGDGALAGEFPISADLPPKVAEISNCCVLASFVLADVAATAGNSAAGGPTSPNATTAAAGEFDTTRVDFSAISFLRAVAAHVEQRYLRGLNIHVVIGGAPDAVQTPILRVHYDALALLALCGNEEATPAPPALLSGDARVSLLGVFGGQGSGPDYFEELQQLFIRYGRLLEPLLGPVGEALEGQANSIEAAALDFAKGGIDFRAWLADAPRRPSSQYLLTAPVSLPMIALIQLCHYWVVSRITKIPLDVLRSRFVTFAGHSQGIVSAVVASSSGDEEAFVGATRRAVCFLFWMGLRCQQHFPPVTMSPSVLEDSLANGEGTPTPMMSIRHLRTETVRKHVEATNKHVQPELRIEVSLVNGPRFTIASGPPQSLHALAVSLRKLRASSKADQSRIPFSQRKLAFTTSYLPVTVPFHSTYLGGVPEALAVDMRRLGISFSALELSVPISGPAPAEAAVVGGGDLVTLLARSICCLPQDWVKSSEIAGLTHLLDFGPGGTSGVGGLTAVNKDGTGVAVILAGPLTSHNDKLAPKAAMFDARPETLRFAPNWAVDFAPRLCRRESDGRVFVDTKYTRVIGKPPVMVAGMTPSTVHHDFVAACTTAGYMVELAGGGHVNEKALRDRIAALMKVLPPGEGITVNILFLNPHQWGFQYPLLQTLRREGVPIDGITIAAGVPSLENANEIVANIAAAGIRYVGFKPGSIESIHRVVAIAEANPTVPILLQWTGGRGGGHHSFEDFSDPMLAAYGKIRRAANIILVAGSGIGDAEHSLQYLTGEWSAPFNVARMPFDAVLVASRMMVAKEGKAADAVKQLIVDAPGIAEESQWEETYVKPTGGIITVISELGEPIHKIANRAMMLWKNLDDTIFKLPKNKVTAALAERKDSIIASLNKDYHRVWFGRKADGTVTDVGFMTYEEVVRRAVSLMFVAEQRRWIDPTLRETVFDLLVRVEERFCAKPTRGVVQNSAQLQDPLPLIDAFFAAYPAATMSLLTTEDVLFFLNLCRKRGRKPVPFIPVLDENFVTWFKKDSLWQSEDLDAVPDKDAQRVCILQGPLAVRFCTKVNEPAKDILDGIHDGFVKMLAAGPAGAAVTPRDVLYLGPGTALSSASSVSASADGSSVSGGRGGLQARRGGSASTPAFVKPISSAADKVVFSFTGVGASAVDGAWLDYVAGPGQSWLRALLTTPSVVQGKLVVANPVLALCSHPRKGQTVLIAGPWTKPTACEFYDTSAARAASVVARYEAESGRIQLLLNEFAESGDVLATLTLLYRFVPSQGYAPIHEIMDDRDERIKAFYRGLWFRVPRAATADAAATGAPCSVATTVLSSSPSREALQLETPSGLEDLCFTTEAAVRRDDIIKFCRVVGNQASIFVDLRHERLTAPMDFGIVVAWEAIAECLLDRRIAGDLLRLVHLSNSYTMLGTRMLTEGDVVTTTSLISAIQVEPTGKELHVKAVLRVGETSVMEVESKFFYRGQYPSTGAFRRFTEKPLEVVIADKKDVAVLLSKPWMHWKSSKQQQQQQGARYQRPGTRLVFNLTTYQRQDASNPSLFERVVTKGTVTTETSTKEVVLVARVEYDSLTADGGASVKQNPVMDFLTRVGRTIALQSTFASEASLVPDDSLPVATALSNRPYAGVSGDRNPIHVNPYFADLAGLPATITHGMWTSAACRRFVEVFAADNQPERVKFYEARFVDFVIPGDTLRVRLFWTGMRNGRKVVRVECANQHDRTVLAGSAEVENPATAYVFTGQGSQEVAMGMDLYDSSPLARQIWDRADAHFLKSYGVSILEIVRKNPKEFTVYFGGENGAAIRDNYMRMTFEEESGEGGVTTTRQLFPEIDDDTDFHTFRAPTGLLSATQFTQPALTLMEKAAFEDLKARGYIQEGCVFAGHSLGEYSALACFGEVLPIESLVDVVFYRGITMQLAVKRDASGRSDFAMCAVNPLRVGRGFGERPLIYVVDRVAALTGQLLEIVNYNVENWQYVVAGSRTALATLGLVLDHFFEEKVDIEHLIKTTPFAAVKEKIEEVVQRFQRVVREKAGAVSGGYVALARGNAMIPLEGIDVPFHSRYLYSGVGQFRRYLSKKILSTHVNVSLLVGRYVSNVVAEEFNLDHAFFVKAHQHTNSPILARVLENWKATEAEATPAVAATAARLQRLGYTLLIELLAYQFASPVRWSETMDTFFRERNVDRLIEVGPAPILVNMAQRLLKMKYEASDIATNKSREVMLYKQAIVDGGNSEGAGPKPAPAAAAAPKPAVAAPVAAPVVVVAAPVPAVAVAASVGGSSVPYEAEAAIRTLAAVRAKKDIAEVPAAKSIRDLSAGKSTVQNEIIGDLQKEFGNFAADKPEEMPITELAAAVKATKPSLGLGPVTSSLLSKLSANKFPPGATLASARSYYAAAYGCAQSDGLCLHMLAREPPARLGSEAEFHAWLDAVAAHRGASFGSPIAKVAAGGGAAAPQARAAPGGGGGGGGGAVQQHPDEPPQPADFLRVIVARKLRVAPKAVQMSKSLRDLCGGKSTMQNELLGDIQKEFGSGATPENAAEAPLSDVAMAVKGYAGLGSVGKGLVSRLVSDKMPAGTSLAALRTVLETQLGFGAKRQDAVLLHAAGMEPAARLASDAAVQGFLSAVAAEYGAIHNLSAVAAGGGAGGGGGGVVVYAAADSIATSAKHRDYIQRQIELHAAFIGVDLRRGQLDVQAASERIAALTAAMDDVAAELGDAFIEGVRPMFSAAKARRYDSFWNWARQDLLDLYYSIVFGRLQTVSREVARTSAHVINRSSPALAAFLSSYVLACADPRHLHHKVYQLGKALLDAVRESVAEPPMFVDYSVPTKPSVSVTEEGDIRYEEQSRPEMRRMADYVAEMRAGSRTLARRAAAAQRHGSAAALTLGDDESRVRELFAKRRSRVIGRGVGGVGVRGGGSSRGETTLPYLFLKSKVSEGCSDARAYDRHLTRIYLNAAEDIAVNGLSLPHKTALVTGCGRGSIGSEILKGLLGAGVQVVATTSSFSKATTEFFRDIYENFGSKGSVLVVVPFNQGSVRDIDGLLDYIYSPPAPSSGTGGGLGWDLDFIVPFAALSEGGKQLDGIESREELAHRVMLTNVHRIIGGVKLRKAKIGRETRPAHVVLPLSPNHGSIGGDGLYGESKRALETLFERWHSEGWRNYATVVGAVIGWTRGTGLMAANNIVAQGIERLGARTFSTHEMAFNLLALMHPAVTKLAESAPVWADLGGGLDTVPQLAASIRRIRTDIQETSEVRRAVHREAQRTLQGAPASRQPVVPRIAQPRANLRFAFPELTPWASLRHVQPLADVLDIKQVVVVTGYGEVGPWGNARTRWEMESNGVFSLEGCVEMAWIMGLIHYASTPERSGWVDTATGAPVEDRDVKSAYEQKILAHSGVRLVEPELFAGYDPNKKQMLQQVAIDFDMQPMEVSYDEAVAFRRRHGDKCDVYPADASGAGSPDGRWLVALKRGAVIHVPKALRFDRTVAGQIPTGWSPRRYGIPEDICNQVDPITLYVLVATVEALVSSGITDPYEFYKYVHITEVGNTSGGGVGGMRATQDMYRERFLDNPRVASDSLQETFINTMPAWVNLLLLSSSGHILTPVGACATSVESVDAGVSAIQSGAAKIVIVGGYDDFGEEGSYEFASMKATSSAADETAKGREPREMSRPAASSRGGFMEAQGAGMQVLMSAALAIEMGVPIYGIVARTSMATDREGRSVPAPGIGLLSTARETKFVAGPGGFGAGAAGSAAVPTVTPLLDLEYRRRQILRQRANIKAWAAEELAAGVDAGFVVQEAQRQEDAALRVWGNGFYHGNANIAPLRGALAVFGLTVDDIGVASFHGTGTKANDLNESKVLQAQMDHLGRSKGNALPSIFQKHLTGHPKGAAAAWMLTGMLQCLNSGLIPGNRNADNIDAEFARFEHVHYPSRSVRVTAGASGGVWSRGLKAGLLKSFGFGQVNGEVLVIHADYVLGTLSEAAHAAYAAKRAAREANAFRYAHDAMTLPKDSPWVRVKHSAPYADADHARVALNPLARATFDERTQTYVVVPDSEQPATTTTAVSAGAVAAERAVVTASLQAGVAASLAQAPARTKGWGVDVEEVAAVASDNETFVARNFTAAEAAYCRSRPDPRASFAARWSAKEAVAKALSASADAGGAVLKGAAASLIDIEVLPAANGSGAPVVVLHGDALAMAQRVGVASVRVTLSHSAHFAAAVAVAEAASEQ